jgi:hypothetical protein
MDGQEQDKREEVVSMRQAVAWIEQPTAGKLLTSRQQIKNGPHTHAKIRNCGRQKTSSISEVADMSGVTLRSTALLTSIDPAPQIKK